MDSLGIVNVADKEKNYKPNDEKTLMHQRALVMNADLCIQKYKEQLLRALKPKSSATKKVSGEKTKKWRKFCPTKLVTAYKYLIINAVKIFLQIYVQILQ